MSRFASGCVFTAAATPKPCAGAIDRSLCQLANCGDRFIATHISSRRVTNLHWGCGTPSILGQRSLANIKSKLDRTFYLSALSALDFEPHVQRSIWPNSALRAGPRTIAQLRTSGVDGINLDLMYGLPRQTIADIENSAEQAATSRVRRLALFGYAHVPWFKSQQRLIAEKTLPSAEERIAQVQAASAVLLARGYVPVGVDHLARTDDHLALAQRNGRLHRNFQGYTTATRRCAHRARTVRNQSAAARIRAKACRCCKL
jgi:oxygen-independent coproporphyrinogen III oxidase